MPWRRVAVVVAVAAVAVGGFYLIATSSDSASTSKSPSKLTIESVDLSQHDMRMRAPAQIDAGLVEIELRNRGDTAHDAQLFRVEGDRDGTDVIHALEAPDPDPKPRWLRPAGGVAPTEPGETASVTQVLQPGTYYVADTQERIVDGGGNLVNAAKHGIARVEVTGDETDAELPDTAATITAREYGFDVDGIVAGPNRLTFRNGGRQLHQVSAFRIPDGAGFQEGRRAVQKRRRFTGWVPIDVPNERATTVLDSGGEQIAELTLDPGRYLLLCFVADRVGGAPQWTFGMTARLDVPPGPGKAAR